MPKPINLHAPGPKPMHVQTDLEGELAIEVRQLANDAQVPLAAALRLLALEGLRSRRRLRDTA